MLYVKAKVAEAVTNERMLYPSFSGAGGIEQINGSIANENSLYPALAGDKVIVTDTNGPALAAVTMAMPHVKSLCF